MTLNDLRAALTAGQSPQIELHAVEQVHYIPFVRDADRLTPLKDRKNNSITFPSRFRALQVLARTGLQTVEFVHRSSYDEMVGAPPGGGSSEMRQTLNLESYLDD